MSKQLRFSDAPRASDTGRTRQTSIRVPHRLLESVELAIETGHLMGPTSRALVYLIQRGWSAEYTAQMTAQSATLVGRMIEAIETKVPPPDGTEDSPWGVSNTPPIAPKLSPPPSKGPR